MGLMKRTLPIVGLGAMLLLTVACASAPPEPTATPTLIPTNTPIPPTPTPSCEVVCNVGTERYGIEITCESGTMTVSRSDSTTFGDNTIKLELDQSRTYENTGNTYQINGTINVDEAAGTVDYFITVTGGVFGSVPQVCED